MNSNRIESLSLSLPRSGQIDRYRFYLDKSRSQRSAAPTFARVACKVLVNFHVARSSGRSMVLRLGGGIGGRVILDEVVIEAEA